MTKIIECVPNVSEGRDQAKIFSIVAAAKEAGASILHVDSSPSAHRTVITMAGKEELSEAAYQLIAAAYREIDLRSHQGTHPRLGATDVFPFVPLGEATMEDCVLQAKAVGKRVGEELEIPVFLYEFAAQHSFRRKLPYIRRGGFEGLEKRLTDPRMVPDFGPARRHPTFGALVIGARKILIAYNISLATTDVAKAVWIAERVRESGYVETADGCKTGRAGLLAECRAIGWYADDYRHAQVSLNLLDFEKTGLYEAFTAVADLAEKAGTRVIGSEIIGLAPIKALIDAGIRFAGSSEAPDGLVDVAIQGLGLRSIKPFEPDEKIIEKRLEAVGL